MLDNLIVPFLDLASAAKAVKAEGYDCDARDIVALAAHGEIRLCFGYDGIIERLYLGSDPEILRTENARSEWYYHGFLAIPKEVVAYRYFHGIDPQLAPIDTVETTELRSFIPGCDIPVDCDDDYLLQRCDHKFEDGEDQAQSTEIVAVTFAPPGPLLGVLANDLRALVESRKREQATKGTAAKAAALGPRAKDTYLRIIGALLGYIEGRIPAVPAHAGYKSEADLIEAITPHYAGYEGISKSTLTTKFAEAKRSVGEG